VKAVILAGGFATRLWPLTDAISKPLLAVGDKPMVSYLVDKIPDNIPIIISTNQVFADDYYTWQKQYHPHRDIKIFVEDSESEGGKLGALRAVSYLIKEKKFNEDILILAGDNFITFDINKMLKKYRGRAMVGAYDIKRLEEACSFGVIEFDKSKKTIIGFEEKPSRPKSTFVSTAVYILPQKYFKQFHKVADEAPDNIGNFLQSFVNQKIPVDGYTFTGKWYDVGSFDTYLQLHKDLSSSRNVSRGRFARHLRGGRIPARPAGGNSSEVKGVSANRDHRLINCQTGGTVYVDDSAQVTDSILENVVIFGGSKVHDSVIRNSVIGKNCTIEGVDVEGKIVPTGSVIKI